MDCSIIARLPRPMPALLSYSDNAMMGMHRMASNEEPKLSLEGAAEYLVDAGRAAAIGSTGFLRDREIAQELWPLRKI